MRNLKYSIVENISNDLKININDIYFRNVIFHEMVHLVERKHNKRFWNFIFNKFNNYNDKEKELLEYWFLIEKRIPV